MKTVRKPLARRDGEKQNPDPLLPGEIGANQKCDWQSIQLELEDTAPDCGLNMAHAAVTRHAHSPAGHHTALRWLAGEGHFREWTFVELERQSNRMANVFKHLGVAPGQVVATLCGRVPELYLAALGALKAKAVYCGLYASYGPEPVLHRLAASNTAVLLTTRRLYAKIRDLLPRLPSLAYIIAIDDPGEYNQEMRSLQTLMDEASDNFELPPTPPETPALLHFTSGTTGMPKGVIHVHEAVLHHILTGRDVLDLDTSDVYWCTADPGWVTGVAYGFLAPLMIGATTIVDYEEFDALRWLRILADERVSVWYTSPSAIRRLMTLPFRPRQVYGLDALRLVFSVGEPLHHGAVRWGQAALGVPIRDTWWQTETGAIMIANHPGEEIQPGAMGRTVSGIEAEVLRPPDGETIEVCPAGEVGELALASGWPSMFRGLLGDDEAYRRRFAGRWYLSGDLVRRDTNGRFWFAGRADDMIKTAGHMVSPFEVESVLLEFPNVWEAGVIGVPDGLLGQRVKAYICLHPDVSADEHLNSRIMAFARERLGPALAPREIEFVLAMPKNRAGKIVRKKLETGDNRKTS